MATVLRATSYLALATTLTMTVVMLLTFRRPRPVSALSALVGIGLSLAMLLLYQRLSGVRLNPLLGLFQRPSPPVRGRNCRKGNVENQIRYPLPVQTPDAQNEVLLTHKIRRNSFAFFDFPDTHGYYLPLDAQNSAINLRGPGFAALRA